MNNSKQAPTQPLGGLLAGLLYAAIWLALGVLIISFLLHFTQLKESDLGTLSITLHGLAALAGGFVAGRKISRKGWYYGLVQGLLYGLIILLISFLAADTKLTLQSALLLGSTLVAGGFGGMAGVNLSKS